MTQKPTPAEVSSWLEVVKRYPVMGAMLAAIVLALAIFVGGGLWVLFVKAC